MFARSYGVRIISNCLSANCRRVRLKTNQPIKFLAMLFVFSLAISTTGPFDSASTVAWTDPTELQKTSLLMNNQIYLPLVFNNYASPPPATTSRYVSQNDTSKLQQEGCNQASSGESGVAILD